VRYSVNGRGLFVERNGGADSRAGLLDYLARGTSAAQRFHAQLRWTREGGVSVFASDSRQFILDIDGYFVPAGTDTAGLEFFPVTPCRVTDTLNATVVPDSSLSYLTLWAAGGTQPGVATLNASDGAITSNMAIVPTTNSSIDAFATDQTQLILDISNYFAL